MPIVEPSPESYRHLLRLRVVRHFTDQPVSDADLGSVLEAGRWTGSSKNRQGWRFAVLTTDAQRQRLASTGRFTDPMRRAPVAIALIRTPDGNDFDIGRVAQNLMLASAALGLGSCPVTLHDAEAASEVLALPKGFSCRWAVALGHPDRPAEQAERKRRGKMGRASVDDLLWR